MFTERFLLALYPGARIEEMKHCDMELLDKCSYGLKREYPPCTNYSDTITAKLIGATWRGSQGEEKPKTGAKLADSGCFILGLLIYRTVYTW
ncbi:MAG: hypothetical protein JWM16_2981 [Verrucomicrobiales bacterium]|nr:hypothetical protein [Verrucomicrobiales bacterium]